MKFHFDSRRTTGFAVVLAVGLSLAAAFPARAAVPFTVGDVFAAIGSSQVKHFSPTGTLLETLNDTTGSTFTAGMCFDAAGNLYVTNFDANSVSKFNNTGTLVAANYISAIATHPESCVFDSAGNQYVGTADAAKIYKYSSTGAPITSYTIVPDARGADWIDLSADQCTMLYTSEGTKIKRFDVCANTQLSDFATGLTGPLYAFRILPGGGVLVAESSRVQMLNSSGTPTTTYTVAGGTTFALNRDPDGTTFWTGDLSIGSVFRYNISPAGTPVTTFNAGISTALGGLAIFGELRASQPTPTPTGTVIPPTATRTNTPVGPPAVVPTLSFPMLGLLCAALVAAALLLMRR
jgi:streptogramin lyase